MRHADAVSDEVDPARPLSAKGRDQVARVCAALGAARGFNPSEIWHSPLARAQETAELLAQGLKLSAPLVLTSGLRPNDDPAPIAAVLESHKGDVAVVGHEPHLGVLASMHGPRARCAAASSIRSQRRGSSRFPARESAGGPDGSSAAHEPRRPAREGGRRGGEHGGGLHAPAALSARRARRATGTTRGGRPRSRSATARSSLLSGASCRPESPSTSAADRPAAASWTTATTGPTAW